MKMKISNLPDDGNEKVFIISRGYDGSLRLWNAREIRIAGDRIIDVDLLSHFIGHLLY